MPGRASRREIWHRSHDRCPARGKRIIRDILYVVCFQWVWQGKAMQSKISSSAERRRITLMLRARLSISDVHFLMIKGTPSGLFFAAWAKSIPNRWSLPCSFLWPHWMASVSRHFLWQAREHWQRRHRHFFIFHLEKQVSSQITTPNISWEELTHFWSLLQLLEEHKYCTSPHSAPWKTTRLSHSLHLEGARSFLSLWVWAALDIWAFRKGPGELAVSVTMSPGPENQRELQQSTYVLISRAT